MSDYLSRFSTLKSLLGGWAEKELASGKIEHMLIYYLSKGEPNWEKIKSIKTKRQDVSTAVIVDGLHNHHNHLVNLENCLNILSNEPHLNRYLEHLQQPDSFWQGYSEVESAGLFKRFFGEIELEPHLSNCRSVDFVFSFDGSKIYVEVKAPKKGQRFEDLLKEHAVRIGEQPKAFDLPDSSDRVKDAILGEFEHFDGAYVPSLIIYDVTHCEFDGEDIAERFLGTSYAVIYTNKKTRQSYLQEKRKPDSIFLNDPDLKHLGGIIAYKRGFNIEGQVVYYSLELIGIAFSTNEMKEIGNPFVSSLGA